MEHNSQPQKYRFVTGIIALILVITPLASMPQRAHATLPVWDYLHSIVSVGSLAEDVLSLVESVVQTFLSGEDWYKEWVADPLAWMAQGGVIQSVARSVLTDVVTGQDGSPSFITNMRDQLLQSGDDQVQDIVNQLTNTWAVDFPNGLSILRTVQQNDLRSTAPNRFGDIARSTLENYTSNVPACMSGNLLDGGGLACLLGRNASIVNDPEGAERVVATEVAFQRLAAKEELTRQTELGQGFINQVSCPDQAPADAGGTVSLSQGFSSRVGCITQTLGHTISGAVDGALGAPLQRLMQGDEISEILGSLFVSMVSDMLSGDGLLGSSNPTPGGRTFLDNATDIANTPGGANIVANFIETVANQMTRLNTFIAQWEKIQTAALAAKASCPAINSATIDPVLSEATRELAVARTALIELQALKTRAEQAETEGNPNLLAGLLQDYGAIAVPSPVAISRAQNESRDTADLPQSGGLVQSLYTQMTELTTLCSTP